MNLNSAESIASKYGVSLERAQHWLTEAQNHRGYAQWFIDMAQWKNKNSYYRFIYDYGKQLEQMAQNQAPQETVETTSALPSRWPDGTAVTPHRQQSVGRVQPVRRHHHIHDTAIGD